MKVVLSRRILKREFGRNISADDMSVLRRTAKIVLATPISGSGLPAGSRLLKAYGTARTGPKRVIYLLMVADEDLFLLFYLRDVLTRLPSMTNWQIKEVTPEAWARSKQRSPLQAAA
jgi:hypothetical protein